MKTRTAVAALGALGLVLAVAADPAHAGGPLDGRTFAGETGEQGKSKGDPETFVFADGKFDPLQCHPWGFAATPYTSTAEEGAVRFAAEHRNAKGERMKWSGVVRGETLEGTMTFWDDDGKARDYWFRATLRK